MDKIVHSGVNFSVYNHPFPCCVWDKICQNYNRINRRMKRNNIYHKLYKRTAKLALPRYRRLRFQPEEIKKFERTIELVRPPKISSRLEQLAHVQLRKLLAVKNQFNPYLDRIHQKALNRSIRNSIFSLYARLANVVPPKPREKIYKWTKEDWTYFNKRLKKLAAPKKVRAPAKIKRKKRPLEQFTRTEELALPRDRHEPEPNGWVYKEVMRTQIPSDRTRELAVPKTRPEQPREAKKISRAALKYKITERTTQLSQPQGRRAKDSDLKDNPFEVSRNALKYRATARTTELAEPKEYPKQQVADNKISPAALTYKATPRILELAEPRHKPAGK